ncbi:MAG: BREX-1 system adenine-specific DNA-methyltransferase PglX, partial [Oliverpabstia sp.]
KKNKSVSFLLLTNLLYEGGMNVQKVKTLEAIRNPQCGYYYEILQSNLSKIPGTPIGYWIPQTLVDSFNDENSFGEKYECYVGMRTGDNNRFLRIWHEVSAPKVCFRNGSKELSYRYKWMPYLKGGEFRRWYYNYDYVVNWENDGLEIKENTRKVYPQLGDNLGWKITSESEYFREGITFNAISSSYIGFKRYDKGAIFSNASHAIMSDNPENLDVALAFLNTKVVMEILALLSPTINYTPSDIKKIPFKRVMGSKAASIAKENVEICKNEWDSFENSWNFLAHPLVLGAYVSDWNGRHRVTVAESYAKWEMLCEKRFDQLKANEEELNRIFIDIYGLQDELKPEVEDKDITVRKADLSRDIHSLLSYAVGCMFGRYSLNEPGLVYAGGEWDISKYSAFIPDKDNCIPITDEAYFEDDIVGQFIGWMKKAFGEENLEENLDFIAKALGNKGATSREVIRNYFLNDFIKNHIKIYQKRPIYWLFDSGKQNGFKALVYMHRWNANTVGNLRVEYLHKMQHTYEREIIRMQEIIDNSRDSREVSKATKRKDKLQKQLKETKDYDAKLAHIALSRIEIDLDDGVKVNYEKVQTGRDGKKMQILAKI